MAANTIPMNRWRPTEAGFSDAPALSVMGRSTGAGTADAALAAFALFLDLLNVWGPIRVASDCLPAQVVIIR